MKTESNDPFVRVAAQVRDAIHAARDMQESTRATRRRVRLQGLIMAWRHQPTHESAMESERLALVLDTVRDEADAPMGNIQIFEDGVLRIRSSASLSEAFLDHFAEVRVGECSCGKAFRSAGPVIVDDVRSSPLYEAADRDMMLAAGAEACQSLALVREGRRLGVISLHYREANIPPRRQAALNSLAAEIAEAVALALRN